MKNFTVQSNKKSSEKRNPGFVKLRKGAREHLSRMSSHAWKLYSLLLMAAEWKGERRGTYESNYVDIAQELHWNLRMLQRIMHELREKGYVAIVGAANQYENTLITILKYDQDVALFGADAGVASNRAADSGADSGSDTCVGSKPSRSQSTKVLGAPKKLRSKEEEEEEASTALLEKQNPKEWEVVGLTPVGTPKFQKAWGTFYGDSLPTEKLSDVMERCIMSCQQSGIPVPRPFYEAKRRVENSEEGENENDLSPRYPLADPLP